jgi:hypothetical protein
MKSFHEFFFESLEGLNPHLREYVESIEIIDGKKTIQGDVNLDSCGLNFLLFNNVHVTGSFTCTFNHLVSLKNAPASVGGDFICDHNNLTTLEGAPASIPGDFYCEDNRLTSLKHAPSTVGGAFLCGGNRLTSLQGAPTHVGKEFSCSSNRLKSLKHSPLSAKELMCKNNPNIVSLNGLVTQADKYHLDNFTDQQVKEYMYRLLVKQHSTSSGDADIDKMFDDVLADL